MKLLSMQATNIHIFYLLLLVHRTNIINTSQNAYNLLMKIFQFSFCTVNHHRDQYNFPQSIDPSFHCKHIDIFSYNSQYRNLYVMLYDSWYIHMIFLSRSNIEGQGLLYLQQETSKRGFKKFHSFYVWRKHIYVQFKFA